MDFNKLVEIVAKLRSPEGCPWDRKQDRESLKPYLVEEFYEVIDAMEDNDVDGIREELGDLLFQIVLHSQLSKEEGLFDINEVVDGIATKMVRRHPHVFGDKKLNTAEEVTEKWDEYKKREGKTKESVMDGIPRSLPALIRAQEIQSKATKVGFDWKRIEDAFEKLEEEIGELKAALQTKKHAEIESETGDVLFVLVRIASFLNVNAEDALRSTIRKFLGRFEYIENEASRQRRNLSDMTLEEMDSLWEEAKDR